MMLMTFIRERAQIEHALGRPLTDMDLVRRERLADLSPTQRATARDLRRSGRLVLCTLYLHVCAPTNPGEAAAWISADENDDRESA
jgi:hypothetical protein